MQRPIEQYRQPWESAERWELRRAFIEANQDKVGEARVVSLSHAFANMKLLGCGYSLHVTIQVMALAKNIPTLKELLEKQAKYRNILIPREFKASTAKDPQFLTLHYRQAWESAESWELRQAFIEANQDKVGEARLLSLSHAFVNTAKLQCAYPLHVTMQVAALSKNIKNLKELLDKHRKYRNILIPKGIKPSATKKPRYSTLNLL